MTWLTSSITLNRNPLELLLTVTKNPQSLYPLNWDLVCTHQPVKDSILAKRKNSPNMGWKPTDECDLFRGNFKGLSDVRESIYRLVMRATWQRFRIINQFNILKIVSDLDAID